MVRKKGFWVRFVRWFGSLRSSVRNGLLLTFSAVFFVFLLNGILGLLPELVSPIISMVVGLVGLLILGFLGFGTFSLVGGRGR